MMTICPECRRSVIDDRFDCCLDCTFRRSGEPEARSWKLFIALAALLAFAALLLAGCAGYERSYNIAYTDQKGRTYQGGFSVKPTGYAK